MIAESENVPRSNIGPAAGASSSVVKPRPQTAATATAASSSTPHANKTKSLLVNTPSAAKTPARAAAGTPGVRPATAGGAPRSAMKVNNTPASSAVKTQLVQKRLQDAAAQKDAWAQQREEHVKWAAARREAEMKALRDSSLTLDEKRKLNKARERELKQSELQYRVRSLKASNDDYAQLLKDQREAEKKKRRESAELKERMFHEAQVKEKEIEKAKREEEQSLMETRRLQFLEARNALKREAENRRQSLFNRGLQHKASKQVEKQMRDEELKTEKEAIEFRRETSLQKRAVNKKAHEDKRKSLAFRLDHWRANKQLEEKLHREQVQAQIKDLEIKSEEWRDVQQYKKELEEEEHKDLLWELDHWREERTVEERLRAEEMERQRIEKELFAQECEDVLRYKEELEARRRQSLAYRLDVGRRHRDWDEGEDANRAVAAMQERMIQGEERQDVQRYKQQLDDERRASLAFRLHQHIKEKQYTQGLDALKKEAMEEELQILADDLQAVHEYKTAERDAQRRSLAERLVAASRAQELDLIEHRKRLEAMHADLALKHEDWIDVQSYKRQETENRRKSICYRLDSWRKEKLAKEKLQARERILAEEDAKFKQMDHEDLMRARKAEADEEKLHYQMGRFKL